MKIYQSWKRNHPTTVTGESITFTVVYTSFDKEEIDELESLLQRGFTISDGIRIDEGKEKRPLD